MPSNDPAYARAYWSRPEMQHYQRDRRRVRRAEFFADKTCVDCGGTDRLELDHIDPALKVDSDVWLWSQARRDEEIAKCEIRCWTCHKTRHGMGRRTHGIWLYNKFGCRCEVCCAAKAKANARRRELRHQRRRPELNRGTPVCSRLPEPLSHVANEPTLFDLRQAA